MNSDSPIGPIVEHLPPGKLPGGEPIKGHWMRLKPVEVTSHVVDLYQSFSGRDQGLWTYMPYGPFDSNVAFTAWLAEREKARDPWFYAFVNNTTGKACGMGSFMRADAKNGVIEIGNIWMSPDLQRTREATEVIYLMMRHAFEELGVRRLEWKCDALNAPSRRAAGRFGFTFEGIFRQHMIIKGRNRDTAWFAILDHEWPQARQSFTTWLQPQNFDGAGLQRAPLSIDRKQTDP